MQEREDVDVSVVSGDGVGGMTVDSLDVGVGTSSEEHLDNGGVTLLGSGDEGC